MRESQMELLNKLIRPIVEEKGYEFYHVEFIKEFGENFLRIYIDKEQGIQLEDCENVSRAVSDMLDVEDPIEDTYYLEVSSPGIDRGLYTDRHLEHQLHHKIRIKLSGLYNGKKLFEGELSGFNEEEIQILLDGQEFGIPREKIKAVNLIGEL